MSSDESIWRMRVLSATMPEYVGELVRCKDCERFAVDQSDHDYRTGWWCKRWCTDMVKPDGFCAWAEKREDTDA